MPVSIYTPNQCILITGVKKKKKKVFLHWGKYQVVLLLLKCNNFSYPKWPV